MGGQVRDPAVERGVDTEVDGGVHTPDEDETGELAHRAGPPRAGGGGVGGALHHPAAGEHGALRRPLPRPLRQSVGQRPAGRVRLAHDVGRAVFRLVVDPAHVLPDHAERHQLDAAEGDDGGEQGGVPRRVRAVQDDAHDRPQGVGQGRDEDPEAGVDREAERAVVEGEQSVDAVVQQPLAAPLGAAGRPLAVAVAEGDGVEADPGEDPLGEPIALGEGQHAVHGPSRQQPEVPGAVDQLHVHAAADERVVGVAERAAEHALARAVAARDDLVVAVPMQFQHAGDQLGRVLEVGVHDDDGRAARHAEPGEHGGLLAEVAAEGGVVGAWVAGGDGAQQGAGAVPAAVVHVADLETVPERVQDAEQSGVEGLDDLGLVETRHDDRQLKVRHTPPPDSGPRHRRGVTAPGP